MDYPIELLEQAATPTLSIRRRSPVQNLPAVLGQAYGEIIEFAAAQKVNMPGPAFVIYYNMNMDDLDLEIGFLSVERVPGNDAVQGSEIPAGKYVSAMHTGPYTEMVPLYEAMSAYMIERGLVPSGMACEFYYNSPAEVPESELKTKVLLGTEE